jgi:hypothetical protein
LSLGLRLILAVLLLGHVGIAAALSSQLSLWADEAQSLYTTDGSPLDAIRLALVHEHYPPAYFLLLNIWRQANHGLFFARMLSAACTGLSILVVARVARGLRPSVQSGWIGAVVAFQAFALSAACEARAHAMVILLSAALLLAFHEGFLGPGPNRRWQITFSGLACLALYTHYFLGFLLAGCGVALLLLGGWDASRRYLLWSLPAALLFLPLLLALPDQISIQTGGASGASVGRALGYVTGNVETLVTAIDGLPGDRVGRWAFRLALLCLLTVACWPTLRRRRAPGRGALALSIVLATVFVSLVATTLALGVSVVEAHRSAVVVVPTILVLFAWLAHGRSPGPAALAATLLLAANLWGAYQRFHPMTNPGSFDKVAAYLASHESDGEPILVFPSDNTLALRYHYTGCNPLLPFPRAMARWDARQMAVRDQADARSAFRRALGSARAFWLVQLDVRETSGVPLGVEVLNAVVEEDYVVTQTYVIEGSGVLRRLEPRTSP